MKKTEQKALAGLYMHYLAKTRKFYLSLKACSIYRELLRNLSLYEDM